MPKARATKAGAATPKRAATTASTKKATKASTKKASEGASVDRRVVLDKASRILVDEGPRALSMRRLASEIGASTMVLYSRFQSRDGLMEQLLTEAFTRFAEALGQVRHDDPWQHLAALGRAYRRFAVENPTYYRLMWSPQEVLCLPEGQPAELTREGSRAFHALVHAVTRVLALQDRPAREAEPLALTVWSTVHGFVSLELAGAVPAPSAEDAYERLLAFVAAGIAAGPSSSSASSSSASR